MQTLKNQEATKKAPTLRFAEFTGDWRGSKLGEVFQRLTDKNEENNKNVLTISAQQGLINQEKFFTKSVSAEDVTGYYMLQNGDFAYNKSYSNGFPMGAIKRLKKYDKGVVSTLYICFRLKDTKNIGTFFEKYFDGGYINREINKIAQEGARNHGLLNMSVTDFFEDIKLKHPDTNEQKIIASFLTTVDEWVENLRAQKSALEQYKKGMMQKIFSQGIHFKDVNGNDFSKWEKKKLGELFHERTERKENNEFEMLSVSLNSGVTKQDTLVKRDSSSNDKSNYKVVRMNDIAYNTMRMWQGASGISKLEGIVSPAYTIVYPKSGDSTFYAYLFKYPRVIFDFYRYSQGLTSDTWNLKFKHFSEVEVTTPTDITEQQKIAEFLTSLDDLIESKKLKINQAEQWKKGLSQRMFV